MTRKITTTTERALDFVATCSPRPVSAAMVAAARGMEEAHAARALQTLARRGLAERISRGRYRATNDGLKLACGDARIPRPGWRADRPRRDSFQTRLWAALRKLRKATVPELVQIAGRGSEWAPERNARAYLAALVAAGYVAEMGRREPGVLPGSRGFKRYLLVRDPGPRAPALNSGTRRLTDPNSGAVTDLAKREAAP